MPSEVVAGEPFQMSFDCINPEPSLCPPYFLVMFHGPTRQTIPPENFRRANTTNPPFVHNTIQATWRIDDPGDYLVYAYPDFIYSYRSKKLFCRDWVRMDFPWHKAAVEDTPFRLTVIASGKEKPEGYGPCPPQQLTGRYLSKNPSLSSQMFSDMYAHTNRQFIWAPYNCKIPHRRVTEAIESIPSAKNVLVIGDSTSRGFYCTRIWEGVHGDTHDTVCDYKKHNETYWDQSVGHKFSWKVFPDGRNVSFTFIWAPTWFHGKKHIPVLLALDPPPSHIIFTVGRYSFCLRCSF